MSILILSIRSSGGHDSRRKFAAAKTSPPTVVNFAQNGDRGFRPKTVIRALRARWYQFFALNESGSTDCFVDTVAQQPFAVPQRIGANVRTRLAPGGMVR